MSKTNDQDLNRIIYLMQTDESFDAPQDAIQWSKNIFRSRVAEPKKSVVERFLAVLQMDLSPNRAAFGERSASASQVRQMLFQAGDNGIDLRIKQDEKGLNVQGQILGEGFANGSIIISSESGSFEAQTNHLSEFEFAEIPNGEYTVRVRGGEKEIVVERLELK